MEQQISNYTGKSKKQCLRKIIIIISRRGNGIRNKRKTQTTSWSVLTGSFNCHFGKENSHFPDLIADKFLDAHYVLETRYNLWIWKVVVGQESFFSAFSAFPTGQQSHGNLKSFSAAVFKGPSPPAGR